MPVDVRPGVGPDPPGRRDAIRGVSGRGEGDPSAGGCCRLPYRAGDLRMFRQVSGVRWGRGGICRRVLQRRFALGCGPLPVVRVSAAGTQRRERRSQGITGGLDVDRGLVADRNLGADRRLRVREHVPHRLLGRLEEHFQDVPVWLRHRLQRLDGRLQEFAGRGLPARIEPGVRRLDLVVEHDPERRAADRLGVGLRGVRGGAGEQPGRSGQAADDECTQDPPGTGTSGAALRPPLRPLAVGRHERGAAGGGRHGTGRRARRALDLPARHRVHPSSSASANICTSY